MQQLEPVAVRRVDEHLDAQVERVDPERELRHQPEHVAEPRDGRLKVGDRQPDVVEPGRAAPWSAMDVQPGRVGGQVGREAAGRVARGADRGQAAVRVVRQEPVLPPGEVGVAQVDAGAVGGQRGRPAVDPVAVPARRRPGRRRSRTSRGTRPPPPRTPCRAGPGWAPTRTRWRRSARCPARSTVRAAAEPGRGPARRSRCSRPRTGSPRGSAPPGPGFLPARWSGPGRARAPGRARGPSCSAASSRERLGVGVGHHRRVQEQDRAVRARHAVVQRDVRQAGGRDHRLDPPVEPGQDVVQPAEQLHRVIEAERPGVVPHHPRRLVGLQVEPGDDPGEARAGAARRPQQVGVLPGVRVNQLAVGRHHVQPDHALAGPARAPARSSPGRPAAGSRRGRPTGSGRRGTPGPARPGTARARGRP